MANFRCKMCGAQLDVAEGQTVAVCSFCGSKQTVANADDERKENLFNRANALRLNCEFDKAILSYQSILSLFPDEPEAHWGLCLCKYGIEYVDDPVTKAKKPTIHRMSFDSILKDSDYIAALAYADVTAKEEYQSEAKEISDIQKNIMSISQKEEPFDIFICYKETDSNGKRTPDSVMAHEIYDELTNRGYKIFFSRVTLESKLGSMYEPYIFAALNSAKIMLVIGTKKEYFDAVWVRNEWSRFIDLMKTRPDHYLIPCFKDMDAYEMPEEFLSFQAQDLSKLGFMQDLVRGIDKIMGKEAAAPKAETKIIQTDINIDALLKRAEILIGDSNYEKADGLLERVLDNDPTNSKAYLLELLMELHLNSIDQLKDQPNTFEGHSNFRRAYDFGDESLKKKLDGINEFIRKRNEETRLSELYRNAMSLKETGCYESAKEAFDNIADYKDSKEQSAECEELKKTDIYDEAMSYKQQCAFDLAAETFSSIIDFRDASFQVDECARLKEDARKEKIYKSCIIEDNVNYFAASQRQRIKKSIQDLSSIPGYKDSDQLIVKYEGLLKDYEREMAVKREEAAKAAKAKAKRAKKASLITGASALLLVGVMLLTFLYAVPEGRQNNIEKLIDNGNYDEAYSLIQKNGDYGDNSKLKSMLDAGKAFRRGDYEAGIDYIYDIGGSIDVTYDGNGGIIQTSGETIKKAKSHITNEATKNGYTLYGWNLTDYEIDAKSLSASISLSAVWTATVYRIAYNLNGGGTIPSSAPTSYTFENFVSIPNASRTGYTFLGWTGSCGTTPTKGVTIQKGSTGDKTYIANWEANLNVLSATSTDESRGAVSVTRGSGYTGESVTIKATPTSNCFFEGWYSESNLLVSRANPYMFAMPATDYSLSAKFVMLTATSTDESRGAVSVTRGSDNVGCQVAVKATPIGDCVFKGWYSGSDLVSKSNPYTFNMPATDYSLSAKFFTKAEEEARREALGIDPVVSADGKTITYGLYPQTHVSDANTIASLNKLRSAESNGWYLLDGTYYAKKSANPYSSSYVFDDGTAIVSGTTYWFRCEPIEWKILSSGNGAYSVVSSVLLDAHRYDDSSNSYKDSEIREWLNGAFYDKAFALGNDHIETTEVDNSASTTDSSSNSYACANTNDNVYLLSYKDYTNTSYFADSVARQCKTTDWARANYAYCYTSSSYQYNGWYWTRSPYSGYSYGAWYVHYGGDLDRSSGVAGSYRGVRPALSLSIS